MTTRLKTDLSVPAFADRVSATGTPIATSRVFDLQSLNELNEMLGFKAGNPSRTHGMLYDLDGVLTDPITKQVSQEILGKLIGHLRADDVIAFNSGRSLGWIIENIMFPLAASLGPGERNLLSNLMIVGEKGAAWMTYSRQSGFHAFLEEGLAPPETVEAEVEALLARSNLPIQIDYQKRALLTLEFSPASGKDISEQFKIFESKRAELKAELEAILEKAGVSSYFRIDPTKIALDIEHTALGKARGAARFASWLDLNGISPDHITTFGDSKSDLAMGEHLKKQGFSVNHVHVGEESDFDGLTPGCPLECTSLRFQQGTSQFLDSIKKLKSIPVSNADLVGRFSGSTGLVEALAPWYDKIFLAASRIEIDHAAHKIEIHLDSTSPPVKLRESFPTPSAIPTCKILSGMRVSGQINMTRDGEQKMSLESSAGSGILFSSGAIVVVRDASGDEQMITIKRGLQAPVAPGEIQSAAGRCDRPPGSCAFQEAAEEHLILAEKEGRKTFLAFDGSPFMDGERTIATVLAARDKAIAEMEQRLALYMAGRSDGREGSAPHEASQFAPEILKLRREIHLLGSVSEVTLVPSSPPAAGRIPLYDITTRIDGNPVELAPNMHAVYQEDSNTLELRRVIQPDTAGFQIVGIYDGDGFGRDVKLMNSKELLAPELNLHWPTRQFVEAYFKIPKTAESAADTSAGTSSPPPGP